MTTGSDIDGATQRGRLERLLESATVPVLVDGSPIQTGFFVAPGAVLTALHGIAKTFNSNPAATFSVKYNGREYSVAVEAANAEANGSLDAALLRLVDPVDHPCVLLKPDIDVGDTFFSWGYPDVGPDGEGTVVRREGERREGQHRLVKLYEGLIRPGQSGAPLMNLRTGCVCALIKSTRGKQAAVGGAAVALSDVLAQWPTLAIENERAHPVASEWRRCLPPGLVEKYLRVVQHVMHDTFSDLHRGIGVDLAAAWIAPEIAKPDEASDSNPRAADPTSYENVLFEVVTEEASAPLSELDAGSRLAIRDKIRCMTGPSESARAVIVEKTDVHLGPFDQAFLSVLTGAAPWIVVEGVAGSGKSSLLVHIAKHCYYQPLAVGLPEPRLPIIVKAAGLRHGVGSLEDRLWNALLEREEFIEAGFSGLTEVFAATQVRWLLLVDGLDEAAAGIADFVRLLPVLNERACSAIAVGRPLKLPDDVALALDGHRYVLMPWTRRHLETFIARVARESADDFANALEHCPGELASTPLFATAAWLAFTRGGPESLRTTASVFQAYMEALTAECRRQLQDPRPDLHSARLAQMVALMALASAGKADTNLLQTSARSIESLAGSDAAPGQARKWAVESIKAIGRTSTFFRVRGEHIEWRHLLLRDFAAAEAIAAVALGFDVINVENVAALDALIAGYEQTNRPRVALFVASLLCDQGKIGRQLVTRLFGRWRSRQVDSSIVLAGEALAEGADCEPEFIAATLNELREAAIQFSAEGTCGRILGGEFSDVALGYRRLLALKEMRARPSYKAFVDNIVAALVERVRLWTNSFSSAAVSDLLVLGASDEARDILDRHDVSSSTRWDVVAQLWLHDEPVPLSSVRSIIKDQLRSEPDGGSAPSILRYLGLAPTDIKALLGDKTIPITFRVDLLDKCKLDETMLASVASTEVDLEPELRAIIRLSARQVDDQALGELWRAASETPGGAMLASRLVRAARQNPTALLDFISWDRAPEHARLDAAESLVQSVEHLSLAQRRSLQPALGQSAESLHRIADHNDELAHRATTLQGRLLAAAGKWDESIECFERLYRSNPGDYWSLIWAIDVAIDGERYGSALRLTDTIPEGESSATIRCRRGRALFYDNQYREAATLFESEARQYELDPWELWLLGSSLLQTLRIDCARAVAAHLIEQHPDSTYGYVLRTNAAVIADGDDRAAATELLEAARHREIGALVTWRLAKLTLDLGNLKFAEFAMEHLANSRGHAEDIELEVFWACRQFDEAESLAARLEEQEPASEWYPYVVGVSQLGRGGLATARASLERALHLSDNTHQTSPRIASNRALTLFALGRPSDARGLYQRLLEGNELEQLLLWSRRELRKLSSVPGIGSDVATYASELERAARLRLKPFARDWRPNLSWDEYLRHPFKVNLATRFVDLFRAKR